MPWNPPQWGCRGEENSNPLAGSLWRRLDRLRIDQLAMSRGVGGASRPRPRPHSSGFAYALIPRSRDFKAALRIARAGVLPTRVKGFWSGKRGACLFFLSYPIVLAVKALRCSRATRVPLLAGWPVASL